ncbi:MAG: DUF6048 family protein [Paludibacter sp.]|jgi:hypothetical protein|nr:DUF6048 family protein [Paludibacter sp.]
MSQNTENKKDSVKVRKTWFHGIRAEADLASIVKSAISKETYSFEGAAQADVLHKYFPVVELGYAGANHFTNNGINFKTNGLFGRAGVDFKILNQKPDEKPVPHLLIAGVRLGMSPFNYNVSNIQIADNYWNETQTIDLQNNKTFKIWFEGSASIRVELYKNIFMGWTVRFKGKFAEDKKGQINPWYIPGYGVNNDSHWDFGYSIGYNFK